MHLFITCNLTINKSFRINKKSVSVYELPEQYHIIPNEAHL